MTLKQLLQEIKNKEDQIDKLKNEASELIKQLPELTPFKVGDKVKVTNEWKNPKETICFISEVEYRSWTHDRIEYHFSKIKKDGTMSQQSAGIYSYDKIEKI